MSMLTQLRAARAQLIAQNPSVVIPMRKPLISDGFSGWTRDGIAVAQAAARIRIAHESSGVQKDVAVPSGLGTSLSLYAITDYSAPLEEGDTFVWDGFTWTVGPVNEMKIEGQVYGTSAPLVRGSAIPVTIPLDLEATAESSTEISLAWEDTGAVNTYSIERKHGTGAFAVVGTAAAGARAFADSGLTPSTAYTYRIRAYSGATPSEYSNEDTATTEATP